MFLEEAHWIRTAIAGLALKSGSKVADVGSSDLFYRTRIQPHVHENIYAPLLKQSVQVISCDAKQELGVDMVVDLADRESLLGHRFDMTFDLVLCANMLEHVRDRELAIAHLVSLLRPRGYLLLTVPHTYFYHEDPIDTMYRPTPDSLANLVKQKTPCVVIKECILPITQRQYYLMPVYPNILLHNLPFFAYRVAWRWLIPRFRWKVTCLLLQMA
jgi:SAM-dependent methyltransferase